jgi:CBS-domain-containing membrane protein
MSQEVRYCFDDADTAEVLQNMAALQVRRLPVVDRDKQLVGIVSISDLAGQGDVTLAGEALCEITRPSDLHSQAL